MRATLRTNHWRHEVSVAAGEVSAPVFLPKRLGTIAVKVIPGASGTAEVEYTLDEPESVSNAPGSTDWQIWDDGAVSAVTTRALISVVSGLRLKAYSDTAVMQIVVSYDH